MGPRPDSLALGRRWRRCIGPAPSRVAPRPVPARVWRSHLWYEIESRCAERLAAQKPRQRDPCAGPQSEAVERLVGIMRAGRQVPAAKADHRRQRIAVNLNETAPGEARDAARQQEHLRRVVGSRRAIPLIPAQAGIQRWVPACAGTSGIWSDRPHYSAAVLTARFCSIWPMASTTASKVKSVEACRAL